MSQKRQTVSHIQALAAGGQTKPSGAGRRERRAAETRLRLFRCALQLIAERGFPNVTVEDITEAADVGKGTFFNYFATKDHVLGVMAEIQLGKVRKAASLASQGKQAIHTAAPTDAAACRGAWTQSRPCTRTNFLFSGERARSKDHCGQDVRGPQDDRRGCSRWTEARRDRSPLASGKSCDAASTGGDGYDPAVVDPRRASAQSMD